MHKVILSQYCPAASERCQVTAGQVKKMRQYSFYDNKANIIEFLFNHIYGHREDIIISNIRLFSLLFLFDWTAAIHSDEIKPVTSGKWLLGAGSPYSYDYYIDLKKRKAFHSKRDKEIWQAKRRILFNVNFEGEEREKFSETAEKAATNVGNFVRNVATKCGIDLTSKCCYKDNIEFGEFKTLDRELISYISVLDPLLLRNISVDEDINLLEYAKTHRTTFIF